MSTQDLLSLPQSAVKDFLQGLLRNAKVLKVPLKTCNPLTH